MKKRIQARSAAFTPLQPRKRKKVLELRTPLVQPTHTVIAGAAVVDITPPLEVGLLMSSVEGRWAPFQSARSPLKARALVLQFGKERVALLSLDLLGLTSMAVGGWIRFKRTIARTVSPRISSNRIVITCTHTHNAPESVAITDLYRTKPFRAWIKQLQSKLAQAITDAAATAQPCTLVLAATELKGFSLQRRIPTASGIVMSDSLQPIAPKLLRRGPIDRRVHGLRLRGADGSAVATCVHAICHPVHEMCLPQISADFPGELCSALESSSQNGVPLFFNGAAGDINPPTVSGGPNCARKHGRALARVITRASYKAQVIGTQSAVFCHRTIYLPVRSRKSVAGGGRCAAHLSALRLGSLAMVFVPGELFAETALAIERASPFERTLVVGFAESSIGYVPTPRAFREGGYEIGPGKWSFLRADAESIIRREVADLLREL